MEENLGGRHWEWLAEMWGSPILSVTDNLLAGRTMSPPGKQAWR